MGDTPKINQFSSRSDEKKRISRKIKSLINDHNVRPEDILVLFNSSKKYEDLESLINDELQESIEVFIKPYGGKKPDVDENIFKKNYLTISTIHGAKWYDSYIVFLIGCDQFYTNNNVDLASFYVGATRAKMRLYLTGIKKSESLLNEAEAVQQQLDQRSDVSGNH